MLNLFAPQHINGTIHLSGSKSIHNRLLILNDILDLKLIFENASSSEDTLLLEQALQQVKEKTNCTINIGHAGTDMRFLTAYLATKEGEWILTGSERMKQRPIGELVNALKSIGADISYLEKENYPPLKITGKTLKGGKIEIDGSVSSQFISALLLIAPTLKDGLQLTLKNAIVSWPYIQMTLDIISECGIKVQKSDNIITVQKPEVLNLRSNIYSIESDWSSASYWYSIVALSKDATITLSGLSGSSLQADSVLPTIYDQLGVSSHFNDTELVLTKNKTVTNFFEYNFINCPDIAQTVAVTCFGLGINANLTGLKTLKLKESDRLVALKTELEKFDASVDITDSSLMMQDAKLKTNNFRLTTRELRIETYKDHRMAMSFAPLALLCEGLNIQNPEVVSKSYPLFWEDLKSVGFSVNLQP